LIRTGNCLAAIACLLLASAVPTPKVATAEAWLKAFNAVDAKALAALGDDSADFDRDAQEETGGLDLVRIESDDGKVVIALLRERLTRTNRRVFLTRDQRIRRASGT
jgi:hypothetical protein